MTDNQQLPTFWITGYLPNGVKVSYTVPISANAYDEALLFTDTLLSRGFTTSEPGLNAGEKKDKVGYVLRRSVVNERGETPVIDVYADHEQMTWRTVKVYLNTPEQIAEFEQVSGLKLDSLPYYEGKDSIQRDDPKLGKYVIPVKNTFYAVLKANPKHAEETDAEKQKLIPKRVFVRWESTSGTPAPTGNVIHDEPAQPKADTDTQWNTDKNTAKQLISVVMQHTGMTEPEVRGAVNIVTSQQAALWSEFKNITRSDVWAAAILFQNNSNKDKALSIVGNDPNKRKAIEYWSSKNEDMAF